MGADGIRMRVLLVNVGKARRLEGRSFSGETGIFKEPVAGDVAVGALGLEGDAILNGKHHGGPDQAVYLYRQEDYEWWSEHLGTLVPAGSFGENLTVTGLPGPGLPIGARLASPRLQLEVTAPRIPCSTLAERMQDPQFAKRFMHADRPGIYCRVIEGGPVRTGDEFTLSGHENEGPTTLDIFLGAKRKLNREDLERFLAVPIDERTRRDYEAQLARLIP